MKPHDWIFYALACGAGLLIAFAVLDTPGKRALLSTGISWALCAIKKGAATD